MWNGVNEMLFNVTEDGEPDIRVERRVGCWIDASEYFFLGERKKNLLVNVFVIGFGKVRLRFLRSDTNIEILRLDLEAMECA